MYLRVKQASYVPRYKVDIEFNDGQRRVDFWTGDIKTLLEKRLSDSK